MDAAICMRRQLTSNSLRHILEVIYAFANYVTRSGKKPLQYTFRKDENSIVYFVGEISEACSYYTTDTADWDGKNYKWIKSSAQVSKTIAAEIPEAALYYFVNGTDLDGIMYSTPMIRTKP